MALNEFDRVRAIRNDKRYRRGRAYIPFGAGARTRIGSAFALQEATLLLATVAKNFDLRLAPDHQVWPRLRVTLRLAGGLPMTVISKRSGP